MIKFMPFLIFPALLFLGCGTPHNRVEIRGTCDTAYGTDSTWIYVYGYETGNDLFIKDSCFVKNNRFTFRFDIPYENEYVIFAPQAKQFSLRYNLVLKPGDRLQVQLPDQEDIRDNPLDIPQSYATTAYRQLKKNYTSSSQKIARLTQTQALFPENSEKYNAYQDSINRMKKNHFLLPLRFLNDPDFNQSPYICFYSLVLLERQVDSHRFDSLLKEKQQKFPDYPPLKEFKKPVPPETPQGKQARIRLEQVSKRSY